MRRRPEPDAARIVRSRALCPRLPTPPSVSDSYLPIEDYGLVGNMRTAALVGKNGGVGWLCLPHFDSPSVFCPVLDADKGGTFSIEVQGDPAVRQVYLPDTNVLVTRYTSESGAVEIVDYMPVGMEGPEGGYHRLIRHVRVLRGEVSLRVRCEPAFDYGRQGHRAEVTPEGVVFTADDGMRLLLSTVRTLALDDAGREPGRRPRPRPRAGRPRDARAPVPRRGGDARRGAALARGRVRPFPPDDGLLAPVAHAVHLHRALARGRPPQRAAAQDPDVRADRRDRRRADDEPARGDRRRAQLGLPLLVDPRRRVHALRAAADRVHDRGPRLYRVAPRPVRVRRRRRPERPAPDRLRHRRAPDAHRGDARPPQRLPRLGAGPRSETAPTASSSSTSTASCSTPSTSTTSTARRSRTTSGPTSSATWTGCATTGSARTRGSGRSAARRSSSSTRS